VTVSINEGFDMRTDDRLDEGFKLLRACSREQAPFDLELEERMMKKFTHANRGMARLGKMAAGVLVCIAVAGAAVAATGGFGRILDIRLSPDAGVLDVKPSPDADVLDVKPSPDADILDVNLTTDSTDSTD
jgi:hypothetical protein